MPLNDEDLLKRFVDPKNPEPKGLLAFAIYKAKLCTANEEAKLCEKDSEEEKINKRSLQRLARIEEAEVNSEYQRFAEKMIEKIQEIELETTRNRQNENLIIRIKAVLAEDFKKLQRNSWWDFFINGWLAGTLAIFLPALFAFYYGFVFKYDPGESLHSKIVGVQSNSQHK